MRSKNTAKAPVLVESLAGMDVGRPTWLDSPQCRWPSGADQGTNYMSIYIYPSKVLD